MTVIIFLENGSDSGQFFPEAKIPHVRQNHKTCAMNSGGHKAGVTHACGVRRRITCTVRVAFGFLESDLHLSVDCGRSLRQNC